MRTETRHRSPQAHGSVYVHVLVSSLLITIIGLGSLAAVRVQMRSCRLVRDYSEARTCAVSAVELGLLHIRTNGAWRSTWPNGTWMQDQPLGGGQFTLQGIDPADGDLADSPYDVLLLTGIGAKGTTRHKTQVTLTPVIKPLDALNTCLHASGLLQIKGGKQIAAVGAPISTNGQLDNDGTIDGNAEADTVVHTGIITGTLTTPAAEKRMPDPNVIASYAQKATLVPYAATIEKVVLSPACNPWGPTDPNGLYLIDTGGSDITIRNCRINGTLVVRAVGKRLTLDNAMFLHNYRPDFPVLLVEAAEVVIKCTSATEPLSEASCATNFNPLGAAWQGSWDDDLLDEYPNEIQGLVHIQGTLKLQQTARIVGAVICDGAVSLEEQNTIIHAPSLYACPPNGYTCVDGMQISPGSWKQIID
jgi:hypothetical protein